MEKTQVLVIGAGPVGAVAAFALAQKGIDVLLLEAAPRCHEDMRASTMHPPTLEMMEALGLLDTLEAQGLRAPVYQYRNRRTEEVLSFDLTEIGDVSPYPYRLQCEQFKLARLASGLLGERARFGERLIYCEQDEDGATVRCERSLDVVSYRADYVIAADGASSLLRKLIGVEFQGFTYPEKFLTLSTAYTIGDHFDDLANVSYIADRKEWCVLLRVPDFWRILVPADASIDDETLIGDDKKNGVFEGLLGIAGDQVATHHRTIYRVHQRVAVRYDHGRVLLAGDAAHLNNPLGGFGMNAGIHDAWNLVDKLARILNGGEAAAPLLALYDRQRRTVMNEFVQAQTISNRAEMLDADARQRKMEQVLADPVKRRQHLLRQSMYASLEREAEIR